MTEQRLEEFEKIWKQAYPNTTPPNSDQLQQEAESLLILIQTILVENATNDHA